MWVNLPATPYFKLFAINSKLQLSNILQTLSSIKNKPPYQEAHSYSTIAITSISIKASFGNLAG